MSVDASALVRWLLSEPVVAGHRVLSWVNPQHPGYPYEEAAGIYARWLARDGHGADVRVVERLASDVARGSAGRSGCDYFFDTAVVLAGLLPWRRESALPELGQVCQRLFDFLYASAERRRATTAEQGGARWSVTWSPHLVKAAIALREYQDHTGDPRAAALCDRLRGELATWQRLLATRYVHAFCYGLEGCLAEHARGVSGLGEILSDGAARLARAQRPSGGIAAWFDDDAAPVRADATAQAVRIWCALSVRAHHDAIERALDALAGLQTESGGIRYAPGSEDVNTWATLFTLDALRFRAGGCDPGSML